MKGEYINMKRKELVEAVSDCSISVKNLEEKLNDVLLKYAQMCKTTVNFWDT